MFCDESADRPSSKDHCAMPRRHPRGQSLEMLTSIDDVLATIRKPQAPGAAGQPFPSPADWRDVWIYFVFIDRFARHDSQSPLSTLDTPSIPWDGVYGF